jgi:hypothetical protein
MKFMRGLSLGLGLVAVLLLAAGVTASPSAGETAAPVLVARPSELPAPVQRMREAILAAVASGDIDLLREALEINELMPLVDGDKAADPIAWWKQHSADGTGRDVLALLGDLLALPPARVRRGDGGDNFLWPYLAATPPASLSPAQVVDLYRIAPAGEVAAMLAQNRYRWYRLIIGGDGTWHSLDRVPAGR